MKVFISLGPLFFLEWSEERESDPQQPPWEGGTLPLSYPRLFPKKSESSFSNINEVMV